MANEQKLQELQSEKTEFKREIGVFGGVSILGGIMIGSGVFYIGSIVLQRSGMSMGLALLCWIIGGLVCLLGGLCFAELGAAMPKAGGSIVYLNEAYSPAVGFMCGFSSWLISGAGSISALAIALPAALTAVFPMSDWTIKLVAIGLIIVLTAVNIRGVKLGSMISNIFMVGKVVPLVLILVLGLIMGRQHVSLSLAPAAGSSAGIGAVLGAAAFAVVATLWAYEGWTNLNAVAEEMKKPKKNLPLAIIISLVGVTLLYTIFNFAIYRVVPAEQIFASIEAGDLYMGTAAAKALMGDFGSGLVTVGMVLAIFGSLNGCILAFPRIYYKMGADGYFFKSFGQLHPKYKTPHASLIVQAVIASVLLLFNDLGQLTSMVVFSGMVFNVLIIYSIFIFRKRYPNMERPYKVWGYPVTVVLTLLIFIALMINTLIEDPRSSLIGLVVPVLGYVVYRFFAHKNGLDQHKHTSK